MYLKIWKDKAGRWHREAVLCDLLRDAGADDVAHRTACVQAFLQKRAVDKHRATPAFATDVAHAAAGVDDDHVDFALHMMLASYDLAADRLDARRKTIERVIGDFFGGAASGYARIDDRLPALRSMLRTTPDAFLEVHTRWQCALLTVGMHDDDPAAMRRAVPKRPVFRRMERVQALRTQCAQCKLPEDEATELLNVAACAATPKAAEKAAATVQKVLGRKGVLLFAQQLVARRPSLSDIVFADSEPLPDQVVADVALAACEERLRDIRKSDRELVDSQFIAAGSAWGDAYRALLNATLDAARAGVDLGGCTADTVELAKIEKPDPVRHVPSDPPPGGEPDDSVVVHVLASASSHDDEASSSSEGTRYGSDSPIDDDPKWAWPVDKLAQWIDGAVGQQDAPMIDRKAIVERAARAPRRRAPAANGGKVAFPKDKNKEARPSASGGANARHATRRSRPTSRPACASTPASASTR